MPFRGQVSPAVGMRLDCYGTASLYPLDRRPSRICTRLHPVRHSRSLRWIAHTARRPGPTSVSREGFSIRVQVEACSGPPASHRLDFVDGRMGLAYIMLSEVGVQRLGVRRARPSARASTLIECGEREP